VNGHDAAGTIREQRRKILAGWLIDGTGASATKNVLMVIEKGRIVEMCPFCRDETPETELWLDLSGCTVLPPLMDCHVHLVIPGDSLGRPPSKVPAYDTLLPYLNRHVRAYILNGVLCVRDGGDPLGNTLRYKTSDLEGVNNRFRLKAAGAAWHREGRYGKFIGSSISESEDPVAVIEGGTGPGVDHIKLIQSGLNSLTEYGRQTPPQFSTETIGRIYALSREIGAGLMIHANGEAPVAAAIAGGCDSIEHGYFMGGENLRKLGDTRITWVPTLVPMEAYVNHSQKGSVELDVAHRTLDYQLAQLSKARKYGVTVALGTDSGSPGVAHGAAVFQELKLLAAAGYTAEEAVSCATLNAARLLKTDLPGHLAAGTPATFIVKRGGPEDVLEAGGVEMVVEEGEGRKVP
jgi:imidazolonepropionase-like amidohydrolase